ADMLLDQGLHLELDKLHALLPGQRQAVAVAATSSASVEQLARDWLLEPIFVEADGVVAGATVPRPNGARQQGQPGHAAPRAPAVSPPQGPVTLPSWLDEPTAAESGASRKKPRPAAMPAAEAAP